MSYRGCCNRDYAAIERAARMARAAAVDRGLRWAARHWFEGAVLAAGVASWALCAAVFWE